MEQKKQGLNRYWSDRFWDGDPVCYSIFRKRKAHVIAVPLNEVPPGHVPIMFEDEEEGRFITVPADDLDFR